MPYPIDAGSLLPKDWVIVNDEIFRFLADNFSGKPHKAYPPVEKNDYQIYRGGPLNCKGPVEDKTLSGVPVNPRMIHLTLERKNLEYVLDRDSGTHGLVFVQTLIDFSKDRPRLFPLKNLYRQIPVAIKSGNMENYEITNKALYSENPEICQIVRELADYEKLGRPEKEKPDELDDQMCFRSLYL